MGSSDSCADRTAGSRVGHVATRHRPALREEPVSLHSTSVVLYAPTETPKEVTTSAARLGMFDITRTHLELYARELKELAERRRHRPTLSVRMRMLLVAPYLSRRSPVGGHGSGIGGAPHD